MNYKAHTIFSISAVVAANNLYDISLVDSGLIVLGGLLPDLDANYSFIRNKFKAASKVYDLFPKDNAIFSHRGALLHSWVTLVPFVIAWHKTGIHAFLWLAIGIMTHHVLDMVCIGKHKLGLRWLYPSKARIKIL